MKEILFFIFDNMTDYEITFAMHMLNTSEDFKAVTISYSREALVGRSGAVYQPHRLVSDAQNLHAHGLVICGGWYGDDREELKALIQHFHGTGRLVAGICGAGTYLLAKAGVLDEVKYTTPIVEWTTEHERVFEKKDVFPRDNYVRMNVVRDGNVITSLGHSFIAFTAEIMDWFGMFEHEKEKRDFLNFMNGE